MRPSARKPVQRLHELDCLPNQLAWEAETKASLRA